MALNGTDLGTAIATAMNTAMVGLYPQSAAGLRPYHDALASAIGTAVVTYLAANAVVVPGTMTAGADPVLGAGAVT